MDEGLDLPLPSEIVGERGYVVSPFTFFFSGENLCTKGGKKVVPQRQTTVEAKRIEVVAYEEDFFKHKGFYTEEAKQTWEKLPGILINHLEGSGRSGWVPVTTICLDKWYDAVLKFKEEELFDLTVFKKTEYPILEIFRRIGFSLFLYGEILYEYLYCAFLITQRRRELELKKWS